MYGYGVPPRRYGFGIMSPLGPLTKRLLIANIVIFFIDRLLAGHPDATGPLVSWFALSWYDLRRGMIWQLVSYMFLHGHLLHLAGNMLGLFFFGRELEMRLGPRRFLSLYFGGGILGALGWLALGALGLYSIAHPVTMIGASGAVFAIVGAYAALYPHRQVTLLLFFVIPVTMTARTLAIVFGVLSVALLSAGDQIAHAAHLAGGIAGYVYAMYLVGGGRRYGGGHGGMGILRDGLAKLRRMRFRVTDLSDDTAAHPVDWERVDQILVKIKRQGFGSLTPSERAELERASRSAERKQR